MCVGLNQKTRDEAQTSRPSSKPNPHMHPRHVTTATTRFFSPLTFSRYYTTRNALNATFKPVVSDDIPSPSENNDNLTPDAPSEKTTTPPHHDPSIPTPPRTRTRTRTRKPKPKSPPEPKSGSQHHNSLSTFLNYAHRTNLNLNSTVYLGTHYEYTVVDSLTRLRFSLTRVGRASDRGIDLLGTWLLHDREKTEFRVLVQCKAEKSPRPAMVRELEGAVVGAPVAWRGSGVLAVLAATSEATKGVRDALTRSLIPMAFLNVTTQGQVRQFLWNQAAVDSGLESVGVTLRYSDKNHHEIALTTDGLPWPAINSTLKDI